MRNTFIVLTLVISVLLPGKALATGIDFHKEYLQPIITQYFASNKSEIWP